MHRRSSLVLRAAIVLVSLTPLAACGGDSVDGDGASCTVDSLPGDRACVPGTARSNTPLAIDVAARDGCLGCFSSFEPCAVDVSGTKITVSMKVKSCPPAGEKACPAVCILPRTSCMLPGLAAGTYTVVVTGQRPPSTGLPERTLVVSDDADAISCELPANGEGGKPLDGTKYAANCSVDSECTMATVGDVCSPCKCANAAIATTSAANYAADYRSRTSECIPDDTAICAGCAPVKATCEVLPNALTGTCKVTPGS